jgi:hypothetical protein
MMNTTSSLLCIVVCLATTFVQAQSLMDKLGAIPTQFQLTSNEADLQATEQFIIRRGMYSHDITGRVGLGFEDYSLEFSCQSPIQTVNSTKGTMKTSGRYLLVFYGSDDVEIARQYIYPQIHEENIKRLENTPLNKFFYSISLTSIPVVLLNTTARIDITFSERW